MGGLRISNLRYADIMILIETGKNVKKERGNKMEFTAKFVAEMMIRLKIELYCFDTGLHFFGISPFFVTA